MIPKAAPPVLWGPHLPVPKKAPPVFRPPHTAPNMRVVVVLDDNPHAKHPPPVLTPEVQFRPVPFRQPPPLQVKAPPANYGWNVPPAKAPATITEVARDYIQHREALGPWRAQALHEGHAVLALRWHHLRQGMRTIWDSQMRQRIILDYDEHGDLARIMFHEQDGVRGIAIDPAWGNDPELQPELVMDHMCRSHPLRVEYGIGGQPSSIWIPWLCNPWDNDDVSSHPQNALPRRCVGYPFELALMRARDPP